MGGAGAATEVVGRETELSEIGSLLAAGQGDGLRVLVLTGPPGSGKSTLVGSALDRAATMGVPVLLARPREPERVLAFSVLADLLAETPDLATLDLPAAQHAALGHALGLDVDPPRGDADPRVVAAAVRQVLMRVSTSGRALVVVDDAHWADDSSLLVVSHALHRLGPAPLSVLVATRPVHGSDPWPAGEVRTDLFVGPLTEAAVFHLVRDRLGRTLGRADLRRLVRVSGGNPMFALELAAHPAGPSPASAPLTPSLETLVARSVRGLAPASRRLLLAAALAHDPRLDVVGHGAALEGAGLERAVQETAPVGSVEGGRFRFRHPLHAAAVVADAGPEELRATHARLADLESGAEVTARHLALAAGGPDAGIAARLTAAARHARGRGAHLEARDLAALACNATPPDDPAGADRRLELAGWALHDGDLQTCAELAGALTVAEDVPPATAARAHVVLAGHASMGVGVAEVAHHCRAALALGGSDPLLVAAAYVAWADAGTDLPAAASHARSALDALATVPAEDADGGALRSRALALLAQADVMRGEPGSAELLATAAGLEVRFPPDLLVSSARFALAQQLLFSSRLDEGRAALESLVADSRERGDEVSEPLLLLNLGHLELRAGRLGRTGPLAREALTLAEVTGQTVAAALAQLQVADAECRAGNEAAAEDRARTAMAVAEQVGDPWLVAIAWTILGRLQLTKGDAPEAVAAMRTARQHAERAGLADPGWDPCPGDLAEALLALGDDDAAETEMDLLASRSRGLDRPHVAAVLPRLHAQLRAARSGPDDEARRLALAAVHAHDDLGMSLELGRSLVVAGRLHRRARQKRLAHDLLSRAVQVFDAAPAPVMAQRARDELARVGLRPAAPSALTPTEARVAELAAAGRTNREIAAEVFASTKTVEAVLGRVYRKLGVRSRVELVSALTSPH